tara:strand:- start:961 stop:1269 length:309 start_codon:yes stop_codon:yes gene_type:complete
MELTFNDDWEAISSAFHRMFAGLGDVSLDNDLLAFKSTPPSVPTGISITKKGALVANMPLHTIQSTFDNISFSSEGTALTLEGPTSSYTYTIPNELLALRSL